MADDDIEDLIGSPPAPQPRKSITRKKPKKAAVAAPARTISSIGFPYQDLEAGISVARAILNAGGVPLSRDQLAGVMSLSVNSGNFVLKVATARMFGLITSDSGKYALSPLGFEIVDKEEQRQRKARSEAFLNVPLYKRVYEEFRGKQLPPRPTALEQTFTRLGVSPKQKATARQVFDKSATQAGFFPNGPDRLIEPIIGAMSSRQPDVTFRDDSGQITEIEAKSYRAGPTNELHPFVQGLIDALPEPGTNWAVEGRAKWLQAAANNFDLMYKGDGSIQVSAKGTPHAGQKEKESEA